MARFAGQFVPLKIVTDGNPQWGKWASKYPIDGRGIPRLYVVRADGEKLFGAVGSLPGDQLPRMMLASLAQAGRHFTDQESQALLSAVDATEAALEKEDLLSAASFLSSATQFGSPDEIGSYAKPAIRASELYEDLATRLNDSATTANDELSSKQAGEPFASLLKIAEAEAAYQLFPKLKAQAISLTREIKKEKSLSDGWAQAEAVVKARLMKSSLKPSVQRRAVSAYTSVIRRFPNTEADRLARTELAAIDPESKILKAAEGEAPSDWEGASGTATVNARSASDSFRLWKARSGKFSTEAKFLRRKDGKVQLQKKDGSKIVVDIPMLSDADQAFLESK
ncbi:MAG: SHD1 domain-containing protein [Rubripirellula sp.]